MGLGEWYGNAVVPRITTFCCGQPEIAEYRARVVPLAEGAVFEIGCGAGHNQLHYDRSRVASLAGIDPNGPLLDGARAKAKEQGWTPDFRPGMGEAIPFADEAFDTIVCTYTLCSVGDPEQTMREMRRVLKPGGRLLFLEHGRAPDAGPAKWQRRIEPVWKRLMGNCHLTREVGGALRRGGFAVEPFGAEYLAKAPRWAGWTEWGAARKAG